MLCVHERGTFIFTEVFSILFSGRFFPISPFCGFSIFVFFACLGIGEGMVCACFLFSFVNKTRIFKNIADFFFSLPKQAKREDVAEKAKKKKKRILTKT